MSFQFPASPAINDIFTGANGAQYLWTGVTWNQVSGNPATLTAQARNRIVNGAMQISQELADAGSVVTASYPADQWALLSNGVPNNGAFRPSTQPVTPNGSTRRLGLTVNTIKASLAAGDYHTVYQSIEGIRMAELMWGTASAVPLVLRFTARSSAATGTFCFALRNNGATQSYLGEFQVPAINTDYVITAVIPGSTSGSWPVDNTLWGSLAFALAAGTTFQGTVGWQAANKLATGNITNGDAVAGTLFIADVGLYADPQNTGAAPPWVMPDEAQELAACQRYWQKVNAYYSGNVTSAGPYYSFYKYSVFPRTTPALSGTSQTAGSFPATTGTLTDLGDGCVETRVANATASAAVYRSIVTANARM